MLTTSDGSVDGHLVVAGHDVQRQATAVRREIGVVLQQTSVDGDLSVWENMELHGRMHHIPNLPAAAPHHPMAGVCGVERSP
jgi:ABC-2 type transport system ATP-binding protein